MTVAIIMAQGQQQRVGHLLNGPKQLIPVTREETIFERTVRLLRASKVDHIVGVVHGFPQWVEACSRAGVEMRIQNDPGESVVGAIVNVQDLWQDQTLILLGDVIYSTVAMHAMVGSSGAVFFGRRSENPVTKKPFPELFGLTFSTEHQPRLLYETSNPGWRRHPDVKLWSLLERMTPGWPLMEISDYTDDIDTEDDFVKRLPILREAASKDM